MRTKERAPGWPVQAPTPFAPVFLLVTHAIAAGLSTVALLQRLGIDLGYDMRIPAGWGVRTLGVMVVFYSVTTWALATHRRAGRLLALAGGAFGVVASVLGIHDVNFALSVFVAFAAIRPSARGTYVRPLSPARRRATATAR